jgi:hypothetical protein
LAVAGGSFGVDGDEEIVEDEEIREDEDRWREGRAKGSGSALFLVLAS